MIARYYHLASGLLALVLCAVMSINAQSALVSQIDDLARELNIWRLSQGLGPLVYNPTLERMAASQADFLLRQSSLPNDLHAGARGENPRERSQFDQFDWPTYGHPEIISIAEIAAISNVNMALEFWRGSDIHNRSVTNPAFREVGIAARQYGTDIMFIVVLGGRPDVLPALPEVGTNLLYLTNERARWDGAWIDTITDYRFLDANRQPLTDWTPWEQVVELPEDLTEDPTFVEYRDAESTRTTYEINYDPTWSSLPVPETIERPTVTPTLATTSTPEASEETNTMFATNTPVPSPTITPSPMPTLTPFPTFTPTTTPQPGSVTFIYNDNVFTLYNSGASFADLSGISFEGEEVDFVGRFWEEVSPGLNISALPATQCLVIQPEAGSNYVAASECTQVRSVVEEPDPRYFWLTDFDVLVDGEVIATCDGDADRCEVTLNGID